MYKLRIREVIDSSGLSIKEIAEKCGVSVQSIYRWREFDNVTLEKLDEIAKCLGCHIKDLFVEPDESAAEAMFVWDNERESQLRMLSKYLGGITSDLNNLKERVDVLLQDSLITESGK